MRGHLEQRGKNVWRIKVYAGRDGVTGRKRYVTRTVRGTKRQAEDVAAQMIVEAGLGADPAMDATVGELAARWLATVGPTLSPNTLPTYERIVGKHIVPKLGELRLRALRTSRIDAFYADVQARGGKGGRPLNAASVVQVHRIVHRMLNQGVRWGWLVTNPASRATPPRARRHEIHPPAPAQVLALVAAADRRGDHDLAAFLRLAAVTGARRGELCGLRWTDVDFVGGALTIVRSVAGVRRHELLVKDTKTGRGRRIALDATTVTLLAHHRNRTEERALSVGVTLPEDAFLFSDTVDGSSPWRPARATLAFSRLRQAEGLPNVRLHDLRHAAATQMLARGVPVRTVAGRLGHTTPSTTLNVYAAWLAESDQEAARTIGEIFSSLSLPQRPPQRRHEEDVGG